MADFNKHVSLLEQLAIYPLLANSPFDAKLVINASFSSWFVNAMQNVINEKDGERFNVKE